jgi:hypothetical protein
MYQISNEYLKGRKKKVRKTENLWYFSKSKGHTFVKNQWIKTKLKLDLYLGMAKQSTKHQMNIWKHEGKKCGKLRICDIFLSSTAIPPWKMDGSRPNSNLICILVWQTMYHITNEYLKAWTKKVRKTDLPDWRTDRRTDGQSANLKSSVGD